MELTEEQKKKIYLNFFGKMIYLTKYTKILKYLKIYNRTKKKRIKKKQLKFIEKNLEEIE
jgi:hypothetical protein